MDASGMRALLRLVHDESRLLLLRGSRSVHQCFVDMDLDEALPFVD